MIQLTSRQQALLRFLAAMSGYVSVKDIANQFGYSQRTIRYDLDAVGVWLRDQGGVLDKRPNAGVRLEAGAALRRRLLAGGLLLAGLGKNQWDHLNSDVLQETFLIRRFLELRDYLP